MDGFCNCQLPASRCLVDIKKACLRRGVNLVRSYYALKVPSCTKHWYRKQFYHNIPRDVLKFQTERITSADAYISDSNYGWKLNWHSSEVPHYNKAGKTTKHASLSNKSYAVRPVLGGRLTVIDECCGWTVKPNIHIARNIKLNQLCPLTTSFSPALMASVHIHIFYQSHNLCPESRLDTTAKYYG